jgi:hypothetical protein
MQKVMTVSNPADLRARVEIWLERVRPGARSNGRTLHLVSYSGQRELQRRSVALQDGGEPLGASARRACEEYCSGLGWQSSLLNLG